MFLKFFLYALAIILLLEVTFRKSNNTSADIWYEFITFVIGLACLVGARNLPLKFDKVTDYNATEVTRTVEHLNGKAATQVFTSLTLTYDNRATSTFEVKNYEVVDTDYRTDVINGTPVTDTLYTIKFKPLR